MRGVVKSDVETMVEEIIRGESKNVEFKEMLPKNSEKYAKTIVAFANSQGRKIFFGSFTSKTSLGL